MIDERIRELCARVINSRGAEFDATTKELAEALGLWQKNRDGDQENKGGG